MTKRTAHTQRHVGVLKESFPINGNRQTTIINRNAYRNTMNKMNAFCVSSNSLLFFSFLSLFWKQWIAHRILCVQHTQRSIVYDWKWVVCYRFSCCWAGFGEGFTQNRFLIQKMNGKYTTTFDIIVLLAFFGVARLCALCCHSQIFEQCFVRR